MNFSPNMVIELSYYIIDFFVTIYKVFLAPTGALEEGILCVCVGYYSNNSENEF